MSGKKKVGTFSVTQAVKSNARRRLGTPPPSVPIPDRQQKQEHGPVKHKRSTEDLLAAVRRGEEV